MNPVSVIVKQALTTTETLSDPSGSLAAGGNTVVHTGLDLTAGPFNATSPVVAQQCAYPQVVLTGGTASLDFTALAGTNAIVNGTGQRVIGAMLVAPATNLNPITVTPGGTNGLAMLGPAFSVTLAPGDRFGPIWRPDTGPVIGGTAKAVTFTGTGSGDVADCGFVLG